MASRVRPAKSFCRCSLSVLVPLLVSAVQANTAIMNKDP
jgi:hypothetical protein